MDQNLSVCLIVKNEAHHLLECLESVSALAPEMVIVDTGSTDGTREIASDYGARVLAFDFQRVDFAAARNFGMQQARGKWILVLDADETLHADGISEVAARIAGNPEAGYYLERRNFSSGSASPLTDYVVRLIPNRPAYRYRGRVHETLDDSILAARGRLIKSGIRIDHRFADDLETRRRKNYWYIEILKEEIAENPWDQSRLDFLAAEYHQLQMFDEATELAEDLARQLPLDPRAHLFAGTYHLLFKPDFVRARVDFNTALALQPGYPEAESFLRLLDEKENQIRN
jgi:glycosyltransferase involved in cell wall biosynthesis